MGNHFLIRRKSGEIIHIYYIKGNGICAHRIRSEERPEILLRDGFYDFDCRYDMENDRIHMICQNSEGSIYHLLWEENQWKKREILSGRLKLPYPKHFFVWSDGNKQMAIYAIRHDGNVLLVSQRETDEEVPFVIDYMSEERTDFAVGTEEKCPYVIYIDRDKAMKMKIFSGEGWKNRKMPFDGTEERPIILQTEGEQTHLVTIQKKGDETHLLYRKKKESWGNAERVARIGELPTQTVFFLENGTPTIAVLGNQPMVYTKGKTEWEEDPIKERLIHRMKHPTKIILLSEKRLETVGFFEANGVHLLCHTDFLSQPERNVCFDEFKKDDIEESIKKLKERMQRLERKIASIEATYRKDFL